MWSDSSATMTARNEMPFKAKHTAMPNAVSAAPAISGPITRARLNWIELRAIAFGRCSLSTRDGTSDWCAGPPKACAMPVMTESVRMCQMWTMSQ